mgnify:CR=1 FL=1
MKISDVKTILNITDSQQDNIIGVLLPLVIDALEKEVNFVFPEKTSNGTTEKDVPKGLQPVVAYDIAMRLGNIDVKSLRLGDYSVTYDGTPTDARARIVDNFRKSDVW